MDNRKRLVKMLVFNVIVSALTTLIVLMVWSRLTSPNLEARVPAPLRNVSTQESANPGSTETEFNGQLAIASVIGAGDLLNERVVIEHVGDEDVSLAGWRLVDEGGNQFSFPGLVLHPGSSVTVYSRQGEDTATQLFWNRTTAAWSEGEEVRLLDPRNREQASYTVP